MTKIKNGTHEPSFSKVGFSLTQEVGRKRWSTLTQALTSKIPGKDKSGPKQGTSNSNVLVKICPILLYMSRLRTKTSDFTSIDTCVSVNQIVIGTCFNFNIYKVKIVLLVSVTNTRQIQQQLSPLMHFSLSLRLKCQICLVAIIIMIKNGIILPENYETYLQQKK